MQTLFFMKNRTYLGTSRRVAKKIVLNKKQYIYWHIAELTDKLIV